MERIEKEMYWECDVIDKVVDHLAYEQYLRELPRKICGLPPTPNGVRRAVEVAYAPPDMVTLG
jgi:hypothetical protein